MRDPQTFEEAVTFAKQFEAHDYLAAGLTPKSAQTTVATEVCSADQAAANMFAAAITDVKGAVEQLGEKMSKLTTD